MQFFQEKGEPKAMLFGKSGDHLKALSILVLDLRKLDAAEQHCERFYGVTEKAKKVYHIFVSVLLSFKPEGADGAGYGPNSPADSTFQDHCIEKAIAILNKHSDKVDHEQIIQLLPKWITVGRLEKYLLVALKLSKMRLRQSQLHRALNEAQLLIVKQDMVKIQRKHFTVDEEIACAFCNMKIGLGYVHDYIAYNIKL